MEADEKSFTQKLQLLKKELSEMELKKTGYNGFKNYNYFELGDFLPAITKLLEKHGLFELFSYERAEDGVFYPTLTIFDGTGCRVKALAGPESSRTGDKSNPIQDKGATITYDRRYLYQMVFAITETDAVDAAPRQAQKQKASKNDNMPF